MTLWGKIEGFCGWCKTEREWFLKEDAVICSTCGRKFKRIAMPLQGTIKAHCGWCQAERDWIVTANGNYRCLGCGRWQK